MTRQDRDDDADHGLKEPHLAGEGGVEVVERRRKGGSVGAGYKAELGWGSGEHFQGCLHCVKPSPGTSGAILRSNSLLSQVLLVKNCGICPRHSAFEAILRKLGLSARLGPGKKRANPLHATPRFSLQLSILLLLAPSCCLRMQSPPVQPVGTFVSPCCHLWVGKSSIDRRSIA